MKAIHSMVAVGIAVLALAGNAFAAPAPREQLQALTAQLQQTPADNALREKLIRLAAGIRPSPAIPEEANRAFIKGNVFQKEAMDASAFAMAIASYREALRIAPWWGDAYFNLAVASEAAGDFSGAISALNGYLASVPAGSAEARDARNRIYAVEARAELAVNSVAAKESLAREQAEAFRRSLDGGVWVCQDDSNWKQTLEVRGSEVLLVSINKKNSSYNSSVPVSVLNGHSFVMKGRAFCNPDLPYSNANACDGMARISDDGNTILQPVLSAPALPGGGYGKLAAVTETCHRSR